MKNTFEPTVRHNTLLRLMDDQTKSSIKNLVDTVGYYEAIQILSTYCGKGDNESRILADIGCYMLEDYE